MMTPSGPETFEDDHGTDLAAGRTDGAGTEPRPYRGIFIVFAF